MFGTLRKGPLWQQPWHDLERLHGLLCSGGKFKFIRKSKTLTT